MSTDVTEGLRQILTSVLDVDVDLDDDGLSMDAVSSWDSMAHISIVLAVEQRFRVQLTPEEAALAGSLEQLRDIVVSKL